MGFYVLLSAIMAVGVVAGVLTGNAVSGSSQAPEGSASLPGLRDLDLAGILSPQMNREAPSSVTTSSGRAVESPEGVSLSKSGALDSTDADLQVREVVIPQKSLQGDSATHVREVVIPREAVHSVFGRQATAALVVPQTESFGLPVSLGLVGASGQAIQASRQVPSAVEVILVPLGDVNLNGIVEIDDLLLLSRFIGDGVPKGLFVVDWNGDGFVNVLDLAIVAARLGAQLP